jgi:hypothetical protein
MVSSSILTAVFIFPVVDSAQLAQVTGHKPGDPVAIQFQTHTQRDAFRGYSRGLMRDSRRTAIPDPHAVIPPLLGLYRQIPLISGLSKTELRRMRETTAQRLIAMHGVLSRRESARKRHAQKSDKSTERLSRSSERVPRRDTQSTTPAPEALGGTEAENAQALIALIENTVDPDSWESRGGNGTAIYFGGRIKALVIRQTGEVHRQIGGTLGAVRRAE